ncbi:helix-turn-helix transcriptional regulator [Bacillus cereus]|uniref:AimR family lysis-lysogeny pheromone receptor n=1 Tax=Bacillus cereus TaxID=1396 RepID=UPI0010BF451B|nr:AimR family lysis-lysogeny pheromone receptor [Bacillus cereus]TKH73346.1 helix-turn-helix transcriptional regulator [Bacillus cereus]
MNFVKKRIDDYISEKNLSYGDLGIQVDVTQPTISKWINGESEISIITLCKIIQKVSPHNRYEQEKLVLEHLISLKKRRSINIKLAFIIAYLNRYVSVLENLIELCSNSKETCLRNYSKIFKLYNERLNDSDVRKHFLELERMNPVNAKTQADIAILHDILKILILLDLSEVSLIATYRSRIEENLRFIKNSDLNELISFWLAEIDCYQLLREDNLVEFRMQNSLIQKNSALKYLPAVKGLLDLRYGESYIFSNFNESYNYTTKALKMFESWPDTLRYELALSNLNFLKLIWDKEIETINPDKLKVEDKILYLIKIGEKKQAISMLDKIHLQGTMTPLLTCYEGLAKNNLNIIKQSILLFLEKKDKFFVKLPEMIYNKGDCSEFSLVKEESA